MMCSVVGSVRNDAVFFAVAAALYERRQCAICDIAGGHQLRLRAVALAPRGPPLQSKLTTTKFPDPLPGPSRIDYDTKAPGGFMPKTKPYVRLTQPLIKDAGALRPASWEEALDFTARGLRSVVEKQGGQAFGLFSCSKATNELNFGAQKFARVVMGSNNIDSCNRT